MAQVSGLLDCMFTSLPKRDGVDIPVSYAKLSCQRALVSVVPFFNTLDFSDNFKWKPCQRTSVFTGHICGVSSEITHEKMIRPNARRIVAMVTNKHFFAWKHPIVEMNRPGYPMGTMPLPAPSYSSVSACISIPLPLPASIIMFCESGEEGIFKRSGFSPARLLDVRRTMPRPASFVHLAKSVRAILPIAISDGASIITRHREPHLHGVVRQAVSRSPFALNYSIGAE